MKKQIALMLLLSFCICFTVGCAAMKTGEVDSFQPAEEAYGLGEAMQVVTAKLVKSVGEKDAGKIAVADLIGPGGVISGLGEYLSDKVSVKLFESGRFPAFMERRQLKQVLAGIKMENSGYFDQETVSKFGKMIGVDCMVIGTIKDLGSYYDVTAKIVQSESGAILAVADVMLRRDTATDRLVAQQRTATLTIVVEPPVGGTVVAGGQQAALVKGTAAFTGIPYGECQVVIAPEGYETVRRSISIRSAVEVLSEKLRLTKSDVSFQVFPANAVLTVDGRRIALNPEGFARISGMEVRRHTYVAAAEGYADAAGDFDPEAGNHHVTIRLKEKPKSPPAGVFRAEGTASISYQCDPQTEKPCPPKTELKRRAVEVAKIFALQELSQQLGVEVGALSSAVSGRLAAEKVNTKSGAVLKGVKFSPPVVDGDELRIEILAEEKK